MPDVMYLANMAHTCRKLAEQAEEAEAAFNLYELARIYDRQIAASSKKHPSPDKPAGQMRTV